MNYGRCPQTFSIVPRNLRRGRRVLVRRLRFEPLEHRWMLAPLTVDSLADIVDPLDGFVTLREAIFAANTDTVTERMEMGSGADEIRFALSLFSAGPRTITLAQGELSISSDLTIAGPVSCRQSTRAATTRRRM